MAASRTPNKWSARLIRFIVSVLSSFVVSFWLTARFSKPDSYLYILDHPNARSLHSRPVPRGGGVAILVGTCLVGIPALHQFSEVPLIAIASGVLCLGAVAFVDDRFGVSPAVRIGVHAIVAVALVVAGLHLEEFELPGLRWEMGGWVAAALSAGFIVWMINLYNFMDGMDGFAAGMAVVGFSALALMGWRESHIDFFLANAIVASATGGFLVYNFPPARIFMGDVGSSILGLLAAAFALWGIDRQLFPLWIPVLVFSPFIADATVTLLRRAAAGEKLWEAHRSHYYQRLVKLGFAQRKVVLFQYAIMFGCATSALLSWHGSETLQWTVIGVWVGVYTVYFRFVHVLEARARTAG